MQIDRLFCNRKKHEENCNCTSLKPYYGQRPFKCDILGCSFRRHGFPTKVLRDSHVKHHDRPWKCDVQSCEYAEIGFLSRRMKDEHLDSNHQEAKSQAELLPSNLDVDEIQPLFFDLIRLDKVELVKSNLNHFKKLSEPVQKELVKQVAASGSASMAQVLCDETIIKPTYLNLLKLWDISIESMNLETRKWFISRINLESVPHYWGIYEIEPPLITALQSGSLEIFQECKKKLLEIYFYDPANFIGAFTSEGTIRATDRNIDREHLLLSLWADLDMSINHANFRKEVGIALENVAFTTCSLVLAKALLEYGAEIDYRAKGSLRTPLYCAARHNTPQAAEFLKFLLYHGAHPTCGGTYRGFTISRLKGAKHIAKWVGMSWAELVEKIKLDRERGFCPPEYM